MGPRMPYVRLPFNGAATFQSRTLLPRRFKDRAHGLASMGPRPFSRGHFAHAARMVTMDAASMGARSFSRGHLLDDAVAARDAIASMGPRPFSRGHQVWRNGLPSPWAA